MSTVVYFVELTGVLKSDGTTSRVFGWSSKDRGGYLKRTADTGLSADEPYYAPRVIDPGSWRQSIVGRVNLFGKADSTKGTIRAANLDGGLNILRDYAFDGRTAKIMRGELDSSGALKTGTLTTVLKARVRFPLVGSTVVVDFVDRSGQFERVQLQPDKFAGTGGTTGYEGDANLAGRPRPRCWGEINDLSPPLVASGLLIYQLADTLIDGISEVTDGGDAITEGTDYASFAALAAATTTASTFDYFLGSDTVGFGNDPDGGAYIKLGTLPSFAVTCTFDGTTGGFAFTVTAVSIAYSLLEHRLGYDITSGSTDVDTDALDALEALTSINVGLAYTEEVTISQVFDDAFGSIGAWWGIDRSDRFTCGRLELPDATATPDLELTVSNILGGEDPDAIQVIEFGILGSIPVGRVQLGYQRNYTVLKGGQLDPNVAAVDRAYYAQEFRLGTPSNGLDQDTLDLHPQSAPFQHNTHLEGLGDTDDEAARLLAMLKTETFCIRVPVRPNVAAALPAGGHVKVTVPYHGMDAGLHFTMVQSEDAYASDRSVLTLWGGIAA
ncbi:MAG: hypothetical protein RLO51_16865 [Thalassobaculum sp.]|uniref:hypothetical protein n=1 Tax=Thalassobaculum sp. TaxID=2022740 RepID=UPI0032EC8CAA